MGYQALLFCPEERLARVVTQVFNELDFTVEAVNEPFAAVKKLMAQRYDAIVVDCENEANAGLLFKSARNSSSNQSSLALALVEGQAGVAKAYRIGANLVLTKPINVEQAKGTLRVARGLLRKNADAPAAAPAAAPKASPAPAASTHKAAPPSQMPDVAAKNIYESPEFDAALPAMAASVEPDSAEIVIPQPAAKPSAPVASVGVAMPHEAPAPPAPAATAFQPLPSQSSGSAPGFTHGTAAAPAPARETTIPFEPKVGSQPATHSESSSASFGVGSSPSFAALDKDDSDDSGGNKKILIAAAVLLVVAALGYFGWTKMGQSGSAHNVTAPAAPVSSATPAASAPVTSSPIAIESPSQPERASSAKPSPVTSVPDIRIGGDTEPAPSKPERAPLVVRSFSSGKKAQAQSDEAASLPNPLALSAPNDKNLAGLVSSVPSTMPKVATSTLKISQGVSQGLLIKRVTPRYPQNALSMRVQGAVQLDATINKEGNITNLKVTSGDAVLARAATDAVKQWRYKPYYLNGEPVEIQTQITVNFKLPN